MGDASQPGTVPAPQLTILADGISLLLPLSRRGTGPGLILLTPGNTLPEDDIVINKDNGIPSPLVKWAEESYTVVQIRSSALEINERALELAIEALNGCATVEPKGRYGVVSYDAAAFNKLKDQIEATSEIVGAVIYSDASSGPVTALKIPSVQQLAGQTDAKLPRTAHLTAYPYPNVKSTGFALPGHPDFASPAEAISHTRNLTFLKSAAILAGPIFDLEAIWDEHTYYEFGDRDVSKTMATMVAEPYVNHVPTITGGVGRSALTKFYGERFHFSNPADAELEPISRTVGVDRVVDEFVFRVTHDREIYWLLPGVPPTGNKLEVPMLAVVNIRGDRLYHEHIHWDQATALRQAGLLKEYLDWPEEKFGPPPDEYVENNDKSAEKSEGGRRRFRVKIPVAGAETATKLRDKSAVESNLMFGYKMTYS